MRAWLRRALWDQVPRDHREGPAAAASPPGRHPRSFLVLGAGVLAVSRCASSRAAPGSTPPPWSWPRCGRSAPSRPARCTWAGSGTRSGTRRPVVTPIVLGPAAGRGLRGRRPAGAAGPVPRRAGAARSSSTPTRGPGRCIVLVTAVNGVAEELFFRGAAYAATTRHPVPVTTRGLRRSPPLATGNVMLAFAAVLLGILVGLAASSLRRHPGPGPHPRHLVDDHAGRPACPVRLTLRRSRREGGTGQAGEQRISRGRAPPAPAAPPRRTAGGRRARCRGSTAR